MLKEKIGSIWDNAGKFCNYVVVPTNGCIYNGELIMGAGLALDCKKKFPSIPAHAAQKVLLDPETASGKRPYHIIECPNNVILLQTKLHYKDPSPLWLIEESLAKLAELASKAENQKNIYHVPRVGTGLGKADWRSQIRPLCARLLPSNCIIWSKASDT